LVEMWVLSTLGLCNVRLVDVHSDRVCGV
jgi:hypothetical protein